MYKSFREMPVWQNALNLLIEIFQITTNLPRSEDYGLTSQIRRSYNSVSANIVEGYGRNSNKDKSHFYPIARGSMFETQSHMIYGREVGYFNFENTEDLLKNYDDFIYEINKLIKTLKR